MADTEYEVHCMLKAIEIPCPKSRLRTLTEDSLQIIVPSKAYKYKYFSAYDRVLVGQGCVPAAKAPGPEGPGIVTDAGVWSHNDSSSFVKAITTMLARLGTDPRFFCSRLHCRVECSPLRADACPLCRVPTCTSPSTVHG